MRRFALFFIALAAPAQTVREAVERAVKHYPAVQVPIEQMRAAAAGIALARTAYLPRTDVLAQLNRATRNNVFGLLLPQSTLPTISGPPNPENSMTNVWGSAVGFLVSWEPFDFGLRRAGVDAAAATRDRAQAAIARTELEVATITADAYLTALAARRTLDAATKQAARARAAEKLVTALVNAELRPGADASRSRAEIASADVQVIQAERAIRVAEAALEQLTGTRITPEMLGMTPPPETTGETANHPVLKEQQTAIAESEARLKVLDRTWYPRFSLQASSYARGTGANPDGTTGGALSGIGPNIQNWAAGFTITFPVLERPSIRARQEAERHRGAAERARLNTLQAELNLRLRTAEADAEAARKVAAQTPLQLEAARAAEQQATARYQAGLGSMIEVTEAQRMLTQSELDDALAHLNIWRALLNAAAAKGDLAPFLEIAK